MNVSGVTTSPDQNSSKNRHTVGSAHWTGEEDEWQETDVDYGESVGTMVR